MIFTEDVARLASFYHDKLGFTVDEDRGKSIMFSTPQPGGTQLAIESHGEVSGRSKDPNRADPDGAYVVATLRDPDGNTLQLVEFGE